VKKKNTPHTLFSSINIPTLFYSSFWEVIEMFLHYATIPPIILRRKCQINVLCLCALQKTTKNRTCFLTHQITDLVFSRKNTAGHILSNWTTHISLLAACSDTTTDGYKYVERETVSNSPILKCENPTKCNKILRLLSRCLEMNETRILVLSTTNSVPCVGVSLVYTERKKEYAYVISED
jgi:hypothetical protein